MGTNRHPVHHATDTKLSSTSPDAKTVEMVVPAVLHGDDTIHAIITFDCDEAFKVRSADVYGNNTSCSALNVACI